MRLKTLLIYTMAFALPPLAAIGITAANAVAPRPDAPPAFSRPLPPQPAHDPGLRTAVVVASNELTESSDLLGPYEVLAASGAFNVHVVAPVRQVSALYPGGLDIVPHFSFAEYQATIGAPPDLIVVPFMPKEDAADSSVLTWLRTNAAEQTTVLSICGGSKNVADAGLLTGRRATSHHTILPNVERSRPDVLWVRGQRYVEDGRFISSAGVTSGVDATLFTLERLLGREVAQDTARRVGYPHTRFLDDRGWSAAPIDIVPLLPNAFKWDRTHVGVMVYDGVREIELGSITDTYPRSYAAEVHIIAPERRAIRTRHGLDFVPRFDLTSAPTLDRVLLPGTPPASVVQAADRLAITPEPIHARGGYPYDLTLTDMAEHETRLVAASAAQGLEYPIDHLRLGGRDWQVELMLRGLLVGVAGLACVAGIRRTVRA